MCIGMMIGVTIKVQIGLSTWKKVRNPWFGVIRYNLGSSYDFLKPLTALSIGYICNDDLSMGMPTHTPSFVHEPPASQFYKILSQPLQQ